MYKFSLIENNHLTINDEYTLFPFYGESNNATFSPLKDSPFCGLSLRKSGSMRFRWNEVNDKRNTLLGKIEDKLSINKEDKKSFVPIQLFHTKDVYDVKEKNDTNEKIGDGIVTINSSLIPTITVADCVPIFLYDKNSGAFGIVHSGWKGTGIAENAINLMKEKYGTKVDDVYVVIGPHIGEECYIVNEQRAKYFIDNFTPLCVKKVIEGEKVPGNWDSGSGQLYHLSLSEANVALLKRIGVKDSHISLCTDCTACNELYGSNRRETSLSGVANEFTVMAAFISK